MRTLTFDLLLKKLCGHFSSTSCIAIDKKLCGDKKPLNRRVTNCEKILPKRKIGKCKWGRRYKQLLAVIVPYPLELTRDLRTSEDIQKYQKPFTILSLFHAHCSTFRNSAKPVRIEYLSILANECPGLKHGLFDMTRLCRIILP